MLTLRDLAGDLELRLVAGEPGLDRAVRWVHISELLDPTPWLSGGELLLTTGLQLDTPDQQREYVARLAGAGLTGMGLGTGFAHPSVPAPLREAAEAAGFPLFEVPYAVPFIAVTERASSHIVNAQYTVLRRAIAAHERLERIVLSDGGLEGVATALAELVGGAATVLDARGRPLAGTEPDGAGTELRERIENGARRGFAAGAALALPVARTPPSGGHAPAPQAWLVAAREGGALGELDRLILHQAVTVVALELVRRRVAHDTERRLAGDVLSGLLSGELTGPELGRRLEPFGLHGRIALLVFAPARSQRDAVEDALSLALEEEGRGGMAASTGALTCVLLPAGEGDEEFALAERLRARVSEEVGVVLPAGAGRTVAPGDARRSLHEARCALEARGDERSQRLRPAGPAGDLPRPRLVRAPALAAGRRRAASASATPSSRRSSAATAPTGES
jgi:purine catabolism regulator